VSVRRLYAAQPESFAFSPENLAWAKETIAKYPAGKQASAVIPLLWRAQEQNDNWVSKPVIECVANMLGMAYIRVLEVATFYTMFQLQPVGKLAHVQVCGTTPCMLRGAEALKDVCRNRIHHDPHHLSDDGKFSWEEVECLGACVNAPMVQIFKDTYEDLTPAALEKLIDDLAAGRKVKVGPQIQRHHASPEGGPTTLTDPALYEGQRTFIRVEPPPPPPVDAAAAPKT
jgi:NADH-quinone oxidoreductase subunit E